MEISEKVLSRGWFLLVLCVVLCFNLCCVSCLMTFRDVQQCPTNSATRNAKANGLRCSDLNLNYHCMRKVGGGFAEFCIQRQGLEFKDGCPMLREGREENNIIQVKCRKRSFRCPEDGYFSTDEIYKYPACLENKRMKNSNGGTNKALGTNKETDSSLTGGIVATVLGLVIILASLCGFINYVKRQRQRVRGTRYEDVPSMSLAVRNSHHYDDMSTNGFSFGLASRDECRGDEEDVSEKNVLTLVLPDDMCRVSCAQNSLYEYMKDEDVEDESEFDLESSFSPYDVI